MSLPHVGGSLSGIIPRLHASRSSRSRRRGDSSAAFLSSGCKGWLLAASVIGICVLVGVGGLNGTPELGQEGNEVFSNIKVPKEAVPVDLRRALRDGRDQDNERMNAQVSRQHYVGGE